MEGRLGRDRSDPARGTKDPRHRPRHPAVGAARDRRDQRRATAVRILLPAADARADPWPGLHLPGAAAAGRRGGRARLREPAAPQPRRCHGAECRRRLAVTHGKAALVTGGAVRLGRAIAVSLARAGYDVALHYNSSEAAAHDAAEEVRSHGVRCALLPFDPDAGGRVGPPDHRGGDGVPGLGRAGQQRLQLRRPRASPRRRRSSSIGCGR